MTRHFPAITEPARFGELLRAIDHYAATPVVRAALRLAPMLLLRPGELRFAEWVEIDLDGALWTVPSMRMKRELRQKLHGAPHLVPLSRQAVAVLRDLQPLTGNGPLVFRGERHHDRPMSDNTVNAAMRAMGFSTDEVTGHGFRATARTMLHERLGFDPHVIEAQLAHSVQDALGRAYNRTEFLDQRRKMMQAWADHLDKLRKAPTDGARSVESASKSCGSRRAVCAWSFPRHITEGCRMQHVRFATEATPPAILRLPEVMRLTRLGRSTIYRLLAVGQFPSPVQLSVRAVGWRRSDVDNWTAERPQVSH